MAPGRTTGLSHEENRREPLLSEVSLRTPRWRGIVTLIAAVVLAAGIGQTGPGHAILGKLGLYEEPASYTSLAFLHPGSIGEQLQKQATVGVSFVIRNTGGTPRNYQWSVSVIQRQQTRHVAAGSASVASGQGTTITRAAKFPVRKDRFESW